MRPTNNELCCVLRSLQLWTLLALTIWSIQFLLVTHLSSSDLHEKHSLVHGDHQRQQQQQQQLPSSSSSSSLSSIRGTTNSVALVAELGSKHSDHRTPRGVQPPVDSKEDKSHKKANQGHINNNVVKKVEDSKSDLIHTTYNCTINDNGEIVTLQQVPAFIIIGAQKAGTSALYDLLNLHPGLQGSREPEAHFFDRRLPINDLRNASNTTWAEQYRCKVRETYAKKFFPYELLQHNPHVQFFDKTPDYVVSPGAPFRIQAIAPWAKIVLSLRNPVHRAFSQYRMETRPHLPHLTFEERLGMNWDTLLEHLPQQHYYFKNNASSSSATTTTTTNDPFPRPSRELLDRLPQPKHQEIAGFDMWKHRNVIYRGLYLEQLQPWLQYYALGQTLLVVRYEDFQRHPEKVLHQILDFVGVERPPPPGINSSSSSSSSSIYTPQILAASYGPGRLRGTPGEIAEVEPPLPASLAFLQQFHKPYNDALADVLGEEWRGVWD